MSDHLKYGSPEWVDWANRKIINQVYQLDAINVLIEFKDKRITELEQRLIAAKEKIRSAVATIEL